MFAGIGVDERPLHPACERLLIPHGGGQIVTILRNDLLVDRAPTPDDIDSVDTTLQVQQREQLSDGGDIVGFRLLGHLPEHHQTDAGPVAEQMQRPKPYYKVAAVHRTSFPTMQITEQGNGRISDSLPTLLQVINKQEDFAIMLMLQIKEHLNSMIQFPHFLYLLMVDEPFL